MKTKAKGRKFISVFLSLCMVFGLYMGLEPVAKAKETIKPMVCGGDLYNLALASDGTVWSWGYNFFGQLGDGTTTERTTPVKVKGLDGKTITSIATGSAHSIALASDGTVWSWGINNKGHLGNGTNTNRSNPVQVTGLDGKTITSIVAGGNHSLALASDGTVWAWGYNEYGQLGNGSMTDKNIPVQVTGLNGKTITSIAAGSVHSLAVASDGTLWVWGHNTSSQLGDGTDIGRSTPVQVMGLSEKTITSCAGGNEHSIALASDGTLWTWGSNFYGQLGDGSKNTRKTPVRVTGLDSKTITSCNVGGHFCIALASDSTLWAWGWNNFGQLGDDTKADHNTPILLASPENKTIISVYAGASHNVALASDGTVWAVGCNQYGQLGDGTKVDASSFTQVLGENGEGFLNLMPGQEPGNPGGSDANITATVTEGSGEPTYVVTVPAFIALGELNQTETTSIKSKTFKVEASGVANIAGKQIDVSISARDGNFNLLKDTVPLPYKVYNVTEGGTPLTSGSIFTSFTENGTVTGRVSVDEKDITEVGSYADYVTFHVSLNDRT